MSSEAGTVLLRPALLAVALLAVVLVAVGLYGRAARRRERARLVAPRHAARFVPGHSEGRGLVRVALAALALVFLGLALAGPVRGYTVRNVSRRGLDLVVCIDTSKSMLVRDLRPDRLSRAVREVRGLIDRLRGDRVALIAFSGDAREVAPLTHDRTTLVQLLERVSPADNLVGGTDLGAALSAALSMFDGRTGAHEAVVLLTDGEDLAGEGYQVAETAAERGIRVYVVGMGTESGGKIPVVDDQGGEHFLTDDQGAEVVSALSSSSLQELARVTGGEYLGATRAAAPLQQLYDMRISRLEGRRSDGTEWVPHDRFQWPLVLALLCMLGAAGMRERVRGRGSRAVARGPAAASASASDGTRRAAGALLLIPPLFPLGPVVPEGGLDLARLEQSSLAGEHERALELAAELLEDPALARAGEVERARVLYAVGVVRERAGLAGTAIEAFRRARDLAGPGALRADAVYNVGAVLLAAAEEVRATIPEISGAAPGHAPGGGAPAGPPAPGAGPGPAGDEGQPDPLEVAEAAYRSARGAHLDRVRLGAPDADTRANLELIQRRLRELEELRRQREQEEQEQDQQQEQQDQESEPSDDQQDQQQDPQEQDQPPEDQQSGDEQEPQDGEQDQEQEPDEESEQPEPEDQEPDGDSEQDQQPGEEEPQPRPAQEDERMMTREELQRLLDQLSEIEEEADRVQQLLRQRRRLPVERDW